MREALDRTTVAEVPQSVLDLRLLVVHVPWTHNFLQNFRELFSSGGLIIPKDSATGFLADVFVDRRLPWWRFLQSGAYHAAAILMIWAGSRFLALQTHATIEPAFTHADVIYYTPSEYLPPLDTRRASPAHEETPDPEHSAQPIISLPREAENHSQTIVAPPKLRLRRNVALPNVVAWSATPEIPIAPAPVVLASETSRLAPKIDEAVVAPPAELADRMQPSKREKPNAPQLTVIAPPPQVDAERAHRFGDLDIGHSAVIAPAPQLSLAAQHTGRGVPLESPQSMRVIAPPPTLGASGGTRSGGNMIALSLHPTVAPPDSAVIGNRRGSFATTPEGHRGSSGTAGSNGAATAKGDAAALAKKSGDLPTGLYVGKASSSSMASGDRPATSVNAYAVNPNLLAEARPPRISARTLQPESTTRLSEEERAVFGSRKFYSLSLNMPNLNSAGGSWVIRFAALNSTTADDSYGRAAAAAHAAPAANDDLSAPSATRKVDPAYPLELMRQNVGGTVILYAVIRRDGTVGNIRVLRSVDDRLDRYASQAIAKWQFDPARKDGSPVDVEATFWIPFRPAKMGSGF